MDEAGFAPTLPTTYSWYPVGQCLAIAYEAPQKRRVNAIGAYCTHGPQAGDFVFETLARLPQGRTKKQRKPLAERARPQGLTEADVGVLDGQRFLAFLWKVAGRPENAPADWQRVRPLVVVLDNYSVHTGKLMQAATSQLAAAQVSLFFLPAYAPELSRIEPVWTDVKYHQMPQRSYELLGDLKHAAERALEHKAHALRAAHVKTEPLLPMPV